MTRITWDETQNRFYETGVQRGVLYGYNPVSNKYDNYEVWNGLSKVTESPDGGDESAIYSDNQKYLSLTSAEVLKGTIEAYTYPKIFESYNSAVGFPGVLIGQQVRKKFGMVYTTLIGDAETDTSIDNNYLIHVIYGAKVSPSECEYETINDNPNAITFSWKFTTTPESTNNLKPTASLVFDTRYMSAISIERIENILYGSSDTAPILPSPYELLSIAKSTNLLNVPLGAAYDLSNRFAKRSAALGGPNDAIYDEFNKHIRDYDGQRMVSSFDVDLKFREVNLPSSVESILVYCEQYVVVGDNPWVIIDTVPGSQSLAHNKSFEVGDIKSGSTYTFHLYSEFTMTPKILKLQPFDSWSLINPDWADGTTLAFDAHIYNPRLELLQK